MEQSIDCLHISVLSNNKLHCKVCSPNFYCFKFIFCISPLHNLPLPVSTNHRLPESRKNYYFSDDLFYYRPFPFSCQEKIYFFSQIRTFRWLISFESVVLTIFPDFLTKLKCPPSQITTQSIGPEIINLKNSIGVDEKVQ